MVVFNKKSMKKLVLLTLLMGFFCAQSYSQTNLYTEGSDLANSGSG
ncbi:MAG: hypothetical protein ACI8ZN_002535, partial [Bacteroidia bacterium]